MQRDHLGELPTEGFEDPRATLHWVHETYGNSAGLSCSFGGPGGLVLAHMAYSEGLDIPILFVDTDFLFPETYELKERLEREWGLQIKEARSPLTPEEQAERFGDRLWSTDPDRCCQLRKVDPMAQLLEEVDCWVTALRRDQSPSRANVKRFEVHVTEAGTTILKVNPLVDWTRSDVWTYIVEHNVPYNPLLDIGYASLGCTHCTAKTIGDDERSGRWQGKAKTECGLHTFTQRQTWL